MQIIKTIVRWVMALWLSLTAVLVWAQDSADTGQVQARVLAYAPQGVLPGKPVWLGLQLKHAPHWHTYWQNPGDSGQATELQWQVPPTNSLQIGQVQWPVPTRFPLEDLANFGYDGTVLLPVPVVVSEEAATLRSVPVQLQANWLVCRRECIPQKVSLQLEVPVGQVLSEHATAFEQALRQVPQSLETLQVRAEVNAEGVVLHAQGLPKAWQGRPLQAYVAEPEMVQAAALGEQRWQAGQWQVRLPHNSMRTTSPQQLPVVLALRGEQDSAGVWRNTAETAYRGVAKVTGAWPAVANLTGVSPGLAAALQAAQQASAPVSTTATAATPTWGMAFWLALGGAFLGGLLLNLMPCVFPVLAIKVMGLANHAHSRRALRLSGVLYTVGVVASLLALASVLLLLRAGGEQLGWGFQLQNPWLVSALALLFTAMALNLVGLYEWGQLVPTRWAQARGAGLASDALLSGVLTVLVASPCTAPLLGASLGWAVTMPTAQALLVFTAMGLGLALPVLLASCFPAVMRWLPRPGAWMQTLRQVLAFPLFATVVWLVWVLGQQAGLDAAATLLAVLLALAGCIWAWTQCGHLRWLMGVVFVGLAAWLMGHYVPMLQAPASSAVVATQGDWQPWSQARVQQALQQGQPVFVDYTAAWCVTCQVNKRTVLSQPEFLQAAAQRGVLLLRADWTRADPAITQSLTGLGRTGVPVYVLHNPATGAQPVVLTEILRMSQVQQAFASLTK